MKLIITVEKLGTEVVEEMVTKLCTGMNVPIPCETKDIKVQVTNKQGEWVDFEPTKIRFFYSSK